MGTVSHSSLDDSLDEQITRGGDSRGIDLDEAVRGTPVKGSILL
jgi:hypothetical protein